MQQHWEDSTEQLPLIQKQMWIAKCFVIVGLKFHCTTACCERIAGDLLWYAHPSFFMYIMCILILTGFWVRKKEDELDVCLQSKFNA